MKPSIDNRWSTTVITILIVGTIASSILSISLGSLLYSYNTRPELDVVHFFEVHNPQTVSPKIVKEGEILSVYAKKCNLLAEAIRTKNEGEFVREQPSVLRVPIVPINGVNEATFAPGCSEKTFAHDLSRYPQVTTGLWHIEGKNTSTVRGLNEVTPYYSESFEVVP